MKPAGYEMSCLEAQEEGVSKTSLSREELFEGALAQIGSARRAHDDLDAQGCFAELTGKTV